MKNRRRTFTRLCAVALACTALTGTSHADEPFGVVVCDLRNGDLDGRIRFGSDAALSTVGQAARFCVEIGGTPIRIEMNAIK